MKPRIALALSGGGFRASVFHLGLMRCLAEFGWLKDVDVISTVSGGSIVGAFAVQRWTSFLQCGGNAEAFESTILRPFVKRIQSHNFLTEWLLTSWQWPYRKLTSKVFTRTQAAAELFDNLFFEGQRCECLPAWPVLIMNATNLQSMRAWRFTGAGMGDSRVGHARWNSNSLPLSVCVGASAAFPPVFPPVRIRKADFSFAPSIYGEVPLPDFPLIPLADGGVYDNSGLEALTKAVKIPGYDELIEPAELLIVSDGGAPAKYDFDASGLPALSDAALLYRVDAIARQQVSALRTRSLMTEFNGGSKRGILTGLGSSVGNMPAELFAKYCGMIPEGCRLPNEILVPLRRIRTSLDRFNEIEVEALMYHAYSLTDAFAWCYRDCFPPQYKLASIPGRWQIDFDRDKIALWKLALETGGKAFRLR